MGESIALTLLPLFAGFCLACGYVFLRLRSQLRALSRANAGLRQQLAQVRSERAQQSLAQKLDSIGRLAGGIAHDFNNLLTAILGNVQLARLGGASEAEIAEHLSDIEQAARGGSALTRQLLGFARRQIVEPRVLELNEVVTGVKKLLGRLLGEDVELRLSLANDLHLVRLDPSQVEQLLVNLAVNAREAMPRGGWVEIRTQNVRRAQPGGASGAAQADYVALSVQDSGMGIAEEALPLVFDPFFTTKAEGDGPGLGLSTVHGAVRQAGGFIDVISVPGSGSTFTLYFPESEAELRPMVREANAAQLRGGSEATTA